MYLFCFVFVGLKPFQPIETITGLWYVEKGVTFVLGEMDIARVKPKSWLLEVTRQCAKQLGNFPPVSVGRQLPGGVGDSGPASYRWTMSTRSGVHRALADGG